MNDVLYNEIDPYAADWLENLCRAGHITPGRVDRRSIKELTPADLAGVRRAHFFAGIGVWDYVLRSVGFPDDVNVWTGSCPCQPYSVAGLEEGVADPRHLWPDWFKLIEACRPAVVFGEQVASKTALGWLDLVHADLVGAGYSVGAADLPAASVGAPHKRSRLYFCAIRGGFSWPKISADADADAEGAGRGAGRAGEARDGRDPPRVESDRLREALDGGDSRRSGSGRDRRSIPLSEAEGESERSGTRSLADLARAAGLPVDGDDAERPRLEGHGGDVRDGRGPGWLDPEAARSAAEAGSTRGFWGDCDWYSCRDGKYRPIGPGLFPLAHGAPARVGRLRAYGNAIVAPLAAEFVSACLEALGDLT